MNFEQILISLRKKLIAARKNQDARSLQELSIVFTVLEEIAVEEKQHRDLIVVLSDLGEAARNHSRKIEWGHVIPTEEKLRSVIKQ